MPPVNLQPDSQLNTPQFDNSGSRSLPIKLIVVVIFVILLAWVTYEIVSSLSVANSTGVLKIETSDTSAILEISQLNSQAQYLGKGSASIRLNPGTYLVSAADQSVQTSATIQINEKQTVTKDLNINSLINSSKTTNSLTSKLPIVGPASEYTIDYFLKYTNGQSEPIITVSSDSEQAKQDALSWFSYEGFNPSNYTIQYTTTSPPAANGNYYVGGQ